MRIAGILNNDIVDGDDGICVSLWVQGCPHHCEGCHNPHTWDMNGGKEYSLDEVCSMLYSKISADNVQRNLSILGGEPLSPHCFKDVLEIIRRVKLKFPNIKIYLWTGYTYEELLSREDQHEIGELFKSLYMLIDGRYEQDKRNISLKLRGSSNQRIYMHPHNNYPSCYLKDVTAEIDNV